MLRKTVFSSEVIQRLLLQRAPHAFNDLRSFEESMPRSKSGGLPTVLCIHGFTGVPGEMDLAIGLAERLGLQARAPLLAGHGTTPQDLAQYRFEDWVQSIRSVFDEVRAQGPVVLVGLSLGSLIATQLTLEAPGDVAGLALLSNAFWLKKPHPGSTLKGAALAHLPNFFLNKNGADLGDPEARLTHVTYNAQPLHAAISLERAGSKLRRELFRINRPTLILHGAQDQVTPVENAWKAASRLGTRDVRVVIFPHSHHILTRDVDRNRVADELEVFIRRVR